MFRDVVVGFIDNEAKSTRRVIAAVPNEGRDYRPDPKSRTACELATHLALSDKWFADSIVKGAFTWAGEPGQPAEFTDPTGVASWPPTCARQAAKSRRSTASALTRLLCQANPGGSGQA